MHQQSLSNRRQSQSVGVIDMKQDNAQSVVAPAQGMPERQAALSKLASLGRRFGREDDGNIAILFGLGSLVLFVFAGLALDFTRYNTVYEDLIESMDAAGLAIANFEALNENATDTELKDFGRTFFYENFRHEGSIDGLTIDFVITPTKIIPKVTGKMEAMILHDMKLGKAEFNFTNFDMENDIEITKKGAGRVELALVLDVTGSMLDPVSGSSKDKIVVLQESVEVMLGALFGDATSDENLKVGVVPFNTHVNPGGGTDIFDDTWVDENANAIYHGARFIHAEDPTGPSDIDNSFSARETNALGNGTYGPNNSDGLAMVFKPDTKVNHLDLFDSLDNIDWKGCVEERPYPLDELDFESGSSVSTSDISSALTEQPIVGGGLSASEQRTKDAFSNMPTPTLSNSDIAQTDNTRFVPMFAPDGPNCSQSSGNCFNNSSTFIGIYLNEYTLGSVTRAQGANSTNNILSLYEWYTQYVGNGWNEDFVNDSLFGEAGQGEPHRRYNEFVRGFRHAVRLNHSSGSYWDKLKQRFSDFGATGNSHEHIARQMYVGYYDNANGVYNWRYDDDLGYNYDEDASDDWTYGPNQFCPDEILPLTDDRTTIQTMVDGLIAHGGTNTAAGAMWGWRLLSPEAPFTDGVAYDDAEWQKAIVIMTDGINSIASSSGHWNTINTAYGFGLEERLGQGIDTASEMRDEIDNKTIRICQRMKDEGVLVYTILFDINNPSISNTDRTKIRDMFKACATKPEAPYYNDALKDQDLKDAFGGIAADLVDLHISK